MYDKYSDTPTTARASNLSEELGQVRIHFKYCFEKLLICYTLKPKDLNEHHC